MLKIDAISPVGKLLDSCHVVILALTVMFQIRKNVNVFPQKL